MSDEQSLDERVASKLATLSRAERTVAEYLRMHGREAIFSSAEQIAEATGTSDATVVRTAKSLGYSGLHELRQNLAHQVVKQTSPSSELRRRRESGRTPDALESVIDEVFDEVSDRIARTRSRLTIPDFERAVDLLDDAREVFAFGLGPSEFAARYLALRLNRMGRRARASGITGFRLADELIGLTEKDLVVLYLPGRHLPDIDILLDHNREVGGKTLLITDSLATLFADRVTATLPAMHSSSNFTGEMLCAEVVTDAMLLALGARDEERATGAAELLISLRSKLIQSDSREYVHRTKRTKP